MSRTILHKIIPFVVVRIKDTEGGEVLPSTVISFASQYLTFVGVVKGFFAFNRDQTVVLSCLVELFYNHSRALYTLV